MMNKRRYTQYEVGYRKGDIVLLERMEGGHKWKYICDCGNVGITQISTNHGCCPKCSKEKAVAKKTKHGESPSTGKNASRLYRIWLGMKVRCSNPKNSAYKYYGARGITVCDEWANDYMSFKEWALNNGYADNLSIDRIDVNGNYEPDNCTWITGLEQCYNKRNTVYFDYQGKQFTIRELAGMAGIKTGTMKRRLCTYKWDVERAVTTPVLGR